MSTTKSSQLNRLARGFFVCTLCTGFSLVADMTYAQGTADQATETGESSADGAKSETEKVRPTLDLGRFKINDLRPTRNATAKVTFSMHLAFEKELPENQLQVLEQWQHRLRDQVITAVRISEMKDFQEPDLKLLRRNILIRVNRLFKAKLVEDVLLTEYLFREH